MGRPGCTGREAPEPLLDPFTARKEDGIDGSETTLESFVQLRGTHQIWQRYRLYRGTPYWDSTRLAERRDVDDYWER